MRVEAAHSTLRDGHGHRIEPDIRVYSEGSCTRDLERFEARSRLGSRIVQEAERRASGDMAAGVRAALVCLSSRLLDKSSEGASVALDACSVQWERSVRVQCLGCLPLLLLSVCGARGGTF